MAVVKLIYSEYYDLNLGEHVFPSVKYRLIHDKLVHDKLIQDGLGKEADFLQPEPASDSDILLVHTNEWVRKLKTGTLSFAEVARLEIPYSPEMVRAAWYAAGGSILAAREAVKQKEPSGIGINIGGGFHHAYPDHGEGFCAIHDVAIAIRKLQQEGLIGKAMTVDLDVHHGNGSAAIFARDSSVFTFSMHQENNYPYDKPASDLDVGLRDGCQDEEYLHLLRENLWHALSNFRPDAIFYVAGADPYRQDQLGGLSLTLEGLAERDRIVFGMARQRGIPVAVTLAGGYAINVEDTVAIHVGTVRAAIQAGIQP